MEVPEVKRLKSLEEENARLKKLLAEAMLDKEALQVALGESTDDRPEAEAVRSCVRQWVCRNAVPAVWLVCHFQPAVIRPSVLLLTRNCLYGSQSWHLNAGDLVTGGLAVYCAGGPSRQP